MGRLVKTYTALIMSGLLITPVITSAAVDTNFTGDGAYGNYTESSEYEEDFYEDTVKNEETNTEETEQSSENFWKNPEDNMSGSLGSNNTGEDYDPTYNNGYDGDWFDDSSNVIDDIEGGNLDYDSIFKPSTDSTTNSTDSTTDIIEDIHRLTPESADGMDIIGTFIGPKYLIDRLKHIDGSATVITNGDSAKLDKENERFRINGITLDEYTFNTALAIDFMIAGNVKDLNTKVVVPGSVTISMDYQKGTVYNCGNIKLEPKEFEAFLNIFRDEDDSESVYDITAVYIDGELLEFDWNRNECKLDLNNVSYKALGSTMYIEVNNGTTLEVKIPDTVGSDWTPDTVVNLGTANFSGIYDTVEVSIIDSMGQRVPDGYVDVYQGDNLLTTSRFTDGLVQLKMYPMSAYGDVELRVRADGFNSEPYTLSVNIGKNNYKAVLKVTNTNNVINKNNYLELQEFDIAANGVVTGTVSIKGLPIANVIVKNAITGERYRTDKDGKFEFSATAGTYTFGIVKEQLNGLNTKELKLTFDFTEDYVETTVPVETVEKGNPLQFIYRVLLIIVSLAGLSLLILLVIRLLNSKKKKVKMTSDIDLMMDDNDTLDIDSIVTDNRQDDIPSDTLMIALEPEDNDISNIDLDEFNDIDTTIDLSKIEPIDLSKDEPIDLSKDDSNISPVDVQLSDDEIAEILARVASDMGEKPNTEEEVTTEVEDDTPISVNKDDFNF